MIHKPEMFLDADDPIKALHIADRLSKNYDVNRIRMRRSSSRRGWHFWVINERHNVGLNIKLRLAYGDCYGRIRADMIRKKAGMPTCILFKCKKGKMVEEWKPFNIKEILEDLRMVNCG